MAKMEIKQKANIGSSSLILIFIILCLVTFGLLSLSNSKSDWNLAAKNADAVQTYYNADGQGVDFLRMADQTVRTIWTQTLDPQDRKEKLKEQLKGFYQDESDTVQTDIPMDFGQVLHIALQFDENADYRILSWKVYNQDVYDIENKISVWDGQ